MICKHLKDYKEHVTASAGLPRVLPWQSEFTSFWDKTSGLFLAAETKASMYLAFSKVLIFVLIRFSSK